MSTYYRHRRTEQTKVPYSFRCEQCMQESGLMLAKIAGMEVTMSSNYNVLTQAQDEKLKQKAHKNLVKRIQEVHKDAVEKEIIASDFKDECPHCHKPQSWGISGMKKTMFNTARVWMILGIFMAVFFYVSYLIESDDIARIGAVISIGVGVLAAVCSILINMIKISIKSKKTSSSVQKMLPVIDWDGVRYLLEEATK